MILLIGSNGMLGKDVYKILENKNIKFKDINFPEFDITKLEKCYEKITSEITCVINCTGYTNVDLAEEDVINAYEVNSVGPRNLAIACEKVGAKLVHISTDYVFDGKSRESYSEMDITNPLSVYGKSKLLGENYVREFSNKYFIIRTAWLFGKNGNNFIETMIKNKDREILKVVNDQYGTPTSTIDLAKIILQVIQTEHYGVYHASSKGRTTWYEFAKFIFEEMNIDVNLVPCTTEEFPTKAVRPTNSELECLMLEFNNMYTLPEWKEAVKEYLLDR